MFRSIVILTTCILALLLAESFIAKTLKSVKSGTIGKINAIMAGEIDPEITIWGASTAWGNVIPSIMKDSLQMSVMNMGINGTNIDQYYGLMQRFLGYTNNSKYVFIVVDVRYSLTQRSSFYHIHNWAHHLDNERIQKNMSEIDRNLILKSRYVPFYKLTLYNKHSFSYFREAILNPRERYYFPDLGYSNDATADKKGTNNSSVKVKIDARVLNKIKQAGKLAEKKNIKPILVISPCRSSGLENIENYEAVLRSLKNTGLIALDYSNSEISSDSSLFKDNIHLNAKGAERLTSRIISDLKTLKMGK